MLVMELETGSSLQTKITLTLTTFNTNETTLTQITFDSSTQDNLLLDDYNETLPGEN